MKIISGQRLLAKTTFTTPSAVNFDPVTVVFKLLAPSGALQTLTPTKEAVGVYSHEFALGEPGTWWCRVNGLNGLAEIVATSIDPIEVEGTPT